MRIKKHIFSAIVLTLAFQSSVFASVIIKEGDTIAFLGDSITKEGAGRGHGYVNLVKKGLLESGTEVNIIPAGIAGHKSSNMLARLDKDVLSKSPEWMVLSCGVNDVWHFDLKMGSRTFEGVSLEDYKKNIASIAAQAEKNNIKVIVMTSSMIGENPDWKLNKDLAPYNEFIRKLAERRGYPLAEINGAIREQLKEIPDVEGKGGLMSTPSYKHDLKNKLTRDGVHMNKAGNIMMAKEVLKAMGMSESNIQKVSENW